MPLEQPTDETPEMESYLSDLKKMTLSQKVVIFFLCALFIIVIVCICFVSTTDKTIHFESPFTVNIDRVKFSASRNETSLLNPSSSTFPSSSESISDSFEQIDVGFTPRPPVPVFSPEIEHVGFTRIPPVPAFSLESFDEGSGQINQTR